MDAENLLKKINEETGLHLSLPAEDLKSEEVTGKLQTVLYGIQDGRDRDFFFQQFLLGQLSEDEIAAGRFRFHIEKSMERMLFLIAFRTPYDDVALSVLSSMCAGGDELIKMDQHHVVLIRRVMGERTDEDISVMASSIMDILGSEAMQAVRVSFDKPVEEFEGLSVSYKHAEVAMHLGVLFKNGKRIHSYHDLSLEKLLYRIPSADAAEYLRDNLPAFDFSSLDNETRSTIKVLFANQLNIADAAKELYIHRNTLVYRLDKFQKMTGLDLRIFDDAVICKVAMILSEYTS